MRFDNQTALITGGTQGIGASIAIALAQAGASVVIHGLKRDAAAEETLAACKKHCSENSAQCQLILADLMGDLNETITPLCDRVMSLVDSVDLLVNNAGAFIDSPYLDMSIETFEKTFRLNVASGYFITQFFARRWIESQTRGRVLFTGSINGFLAEPNHTAYDASKGAVASMVRSLCVALAPYGIRVNSIAPGLVRTPLTNQILDVDPAAIAWMKLHTPNNQVPSADSCAGAALFLLSDLAEHVHGQTIFIDGGMSAWQQPDLPNALRSAMIQTTN
jgi:NAD(P)-dependent dehydrogenase (short-subunit alcohol dehydrogenase family)